MKTLKQNWELPALGLGIILLIALIVIFHIHRAPWWFPVVPPIVTLITVFYGVKVGLKNYYKQKWWDKKAEAYQKAIDALAQMKRYCDLYVDLEKEREEGVPTSAEQRLDEFIPVYKQAVEYINTLRVTGPFLISKDAVNILIWLNTADEESIEIFRTSAAILGYKAFDIAIQKLGIILRKDLGIED